MNTNAQYNMEWNKVYTQYSDDVDNIHFEVNNDSIQLNLFNNDLYLNEILIDQSGNVDTYYQFDFPFNLKFEVMYGSIFTPEKSIIWGVADTGFIDISSAMCVLNNAMEMDWKFVFDDTMGLTSAPVVFHNDTIAVLCGSGGPWYDGYYRFFFFNLDGDILSTFSVPRLDFPGYTALLYYEGNYIIVSDNSVFQLTEFTPEGTIVRDTVIAWPENYNVPGGSAQPPIIKNNKLIYPTEKSDDMDIDYKYVIKMDMDDWGTIEFIPIITLTDKWFTSNIYPHIDDDGFESFYCTFTTTEDRKYFYKDYDEDGNVVELDSFLLADYIDFSWSFKNIKSYYRDGFLFYFNRFLGDSMSVVLFYQPNGEIVIDTFDVGYGILSDLALLESGEYLYLYNEKVTLVTAENPRSVEITKLKLITDEIEDNHLPSSSSISIYPNPANLLINIETENLNGLIKIQLYNSTSQLIFYKTYYADENIQIDISKIPKGIYFLQAISENNSFIEKLIVE